MAYKLDPRYQELAKTVKTYIIGAYDSFFSFQNGSGLASALTDYQYRKMEGAAWEAALVAVKGYVRARKHHLKVRRKQAKRAARHQK